MVMASPIAIVLFLVTATVSARTSSLIDQVCFKAVTPMDKTLCAQILQSDGAVATANNLRDLSIAILHSGRSNSTKVRQHLLDELQKNDKGSAIQVCKSAYDLIVMSFKSALGEVTQDKDYDTATYDLLLASTDYLQPCSDAVASSGITDGILSSGNSAVPIYGLSAYEALNRL